MKKFFCCMATGSFLGVVALLVLNTIEKFDVEYSWLFVSVFSLIFVCSFLYLLLEDKLNTNKKLKALNKITFGVNEKNTSDEIKIQINKENSELYKIYCNTLIEI
ncbi:MAG: hypothetical protein PUI24_01170 [Spirochaetales bacterium]|nr:hypothetical protein [Spirochaetales bacterium]